MILTITEKEFDRIQKARLHDHEMGLKYSEIHGLMDAHADYHYWYEELTDTDSVNALRTKMHRDYPLPYSQIHYFRRFAELFFSRGSEDSIRPTLAHEFIGDEVDAEYIEGLLIKAKDNGFFTPGAMIAFHGGALTLYPPLEIGSHYRPRPAKGGYREIYEGGKANKDRAKVIRRWLKQRATELAAAPERPDEPAPTLPPFGPVYPWEQIETLAEQIGLRKHGRFTPPGNKVAVAASGFIDALKEAGILPQSVKLPILYQEFALHYCQKIGTDRITATRLEWQSKARKALGLH